MYVKVNNMAFNRDEYYKKYRKSNLTQLSAAIPKDLAGEFKDKLKRDGLSFSQFLKNAISTYLKKGK